MTDLSAMGPKELTLLYMDQWRSPIPPRPINDEVGGAEMKPYSTPNIVQIQFDNSGPSP